MTSRRDVSKRRSTDELDSLIRWALRESVAGATASLCVWERIQEDVERLTALRRAWMWRGPSPLLKAIAACLSRVDEYLAVFVAQPARRDRATRWGYDLGWARVLDQHRIVMRLVS